MPAQATDVFAEVYLSHRQGLFTLALAITRDAGRAEDAVQEAFTRLLGRGTQAINDPVAYAYGAVRRAAIDQVRRPGPRLVAADSIYALASTDDASDSQLEQADEDARLRAAVDALADAERSCIVMRVYGELTFQQMATALDEPLSTISSRYRRALEQLRSRLQEEA